jgi:hypothetical protein
LAKYNDFFLSLRCSRFLSAAALKKRFWLEYAPNLLFDLIIDSSWDLMLAYQNELRFLLSGSIPHAEAESNRIGLQLLDQCERSNEKIRYTEHRVGLHGGAQQGRWGNLQSISAWSSERKNFESTGMPQNWQDPAGLWLKQARFFLSFSLFSVYLSHSVCHFG